MSKIELMASALRPKGCRHITHNTIDNRVLNIDCTRIGIVMRFIKLRSALAFFNGLEKQKCSTASGRRVSADADDVTAESAALEVEVTGAGWGGNCGSGGANDVGSACLEKQDSAAVFSSSVTSMLS